MHEFSQLIINDSTDMNENQRRKRSDLVENCWAVIPHILENPNILLRDLAEKAWPLEVGIVKEHTLRVRAERAIEALELYVDEIAPGKADEIKEALKKREAYKKFVQYEKNKKDKTLRGLLIRIFRDYPELININSTLSETQGVLEKMIRKKRKEVFDASKVSKDSKAAKDSRWFSFPLHPFEIPWTDLPHFIPFLCDIKYNKPYKIPDKEKALKTGKKYKEETEAEHRAKQEIEIRNSFQAIYSLPRECFELAMDRCKIAYRLRNRIRKIERKILRNQAKGENTYELLMEKQLYESALKIEIKKIKEDKELEKILKEGLNKAGWYSLEGLEWQLGETNEEREKRKEEDIEQAVKWSEKNQKIIDEEEEKEEKKKQNKKQEKKKTCKNKKQEKQDREREIVEIDTAREIAEEEAGFTTISEVESAATNIKIAQVCNF